MNRDAVLHKVRTALGRSVGDPAPPPPGLPPLAEPPPLEERLQLFRAALEATGGGMHVVAGPEEARLYVRQWLAGRKAIAAHHPLLTTCGIGGLQGVEKGIDDPAAWRAACAHAGVGITSADYALAYTGTLVMIASRENPRLGSLLPPVHLAVVPASRLLNRLDDFLALEPGVLEQSSGVVLITGSSRTADIEQMLVKGVHGPGELHVLFLRDL